MKSIGACAFRKFVAALVCASLIGVAHAHPVLTLTEQTATQPPKGSKDKASSAEFPVRVTLGGKYIAVDSQGTRRIYDFEHRRLYDLNLQDKTWQDASLYSDFAAKALELQNRLRLNDILGAASVRSASLAPTFLEHLFSMSIDDQETPIDVSRAKGATVFSWQGRALLSITDKTQPLPAEFQREYWQWLRYTVGGHPKIYVDLQKRSGVPDLVRIVRTDVGQQLITFLLKSVTSEPDAAYSLDGFTRADPARAPYPTLKKIASDARAGLTASVDAARKDRDSATGQGKMLDAALAHFAYALSSGDSSTEWLVQVRDRMATDADARAFAGALSAKNPDQAAKAVKALTDLRAKITSSYAYLFDVFTANHEGTLKHGTAAEKLFLSALSANPYLTGAWFDLGKLYYGTSRTREAWACWDAARAINPNHPFGKDIDTLELRMVADNPEFF